jgi:hypothetical protein
MAYNPGINRYGDILVGSRNRDRSFGREMWYLVESLGCIYATGTRFRPDFTVDTSACDGQEIHFMDGPPVLGGGICPEGPMEIVSPSAPLSPDASGPKGKVDDSSAAGKSFPEFLCSSLILCTIQLHSFFCSCKVQGHPLRGHITQHFFLHSIHVYIRIFD